MVIILHNPRCSKSRQTLDILNEKGLNPQIRLYLQDPLSKEELEKVVSQLKINGTDLLRKGEDEYKELVSQNGNPDNETAINWMVKVPKLMERPIVINNDKAKIGRPPESILEIL